MKLIVGILAAWAVVVGLVVPMSAVQSDEHRMMAPQDPAWSAGSSLSLGTQMGGAIIPLAARQRAAEP